MPLHLVQVALYSIASFLVGGTVAWRLLGRGHRGYSRKLAQELTDSVHERCSAYRNLEARIDAVMAEFDQCEVEIRNELAEIGQLAEAPEVAEITPGIAEVVPEVAEIAAEGDALSWMDGLDAPAARVPGEVVSPPVEEAAFLGLSAPDVVTGAPPEALRVEETENVVDQFAQKLQILQREKTAELAQQRGRVERLEGRMQSLESSIQEFSRREPAAPGKKAEAGGWERDLQELFDRFARSEGALAAWQAQHETWSRERIALIESAREFAARMGEGMQRNPEAEAAATSLRTRAEELARDAAKLQASITRRESGAPRPEAPAVRAAPKSAPKAGGAPAARPAQAEPAPPAQPAPQIESAAPGEARVATGEVEKPEVPLEAVPSLVAPAGTVESAPGEGTQIGQLMRNLEIAKGDAEKYRRKLHEQGLQFTAAYAMLDRIRPFVQALESEFAAQARGGERKS